MFRAKARATRISTAASVIELIYYNAVRSVRKAHSNAVLAILLNFVQTVVFVMAFYLFFVVLGIRSAALRGDFLLYIMSGIFLYMVHIRTVQAVSGTEGPASAIMNHRPMTTAVAISGAALGALYIQILCMLAILYIYHAAFTPITIHYWPGALGMVILAWASGAAIGLCFYALRPWAPVVATTGATVYTRASMIASGKMFVANQLPPNLIQWFDWNPLFHMIDQARGFTFINYWPHNSSLSYPIYATIVLAMVGLMGEFYTRREASISWEAKR